MHEHANVQIFVHGKQEPVPADIGIDASTAEAIQSIHTHSDHGRGAHRIVAVARVHARRVLRRVGRPLHAELPGGVLQRGRTTASRSSWTARRSPAARRTCSSTIRPSIVVTYGTPDRASGPDPVARSTSPRSTRSGAAWRTSASGGPPVPGRRVDPAPRARSPHPPPRAAERPSPRNAVPGASCGSWRSRASSRWAGCSSSGRRDPARSRPRRVRRPRPRGAATSSSPSCRTRRGSTSHPVSRSTTPIGRRRPDRTTRGPCRRTRTSTGSRSPRRGRSTTSSTPT